MGGENLNKDAIVETLGRKWDAVQNHPEERGRRVWAASETEALGHGGVTIVRKVTGMLRSAIPRRIAETAHSEDAAPPDRVRMFVATEKNQ
jgi:hypothetical protein